MNICAKCGYENDDKAKKCVNCLTDLHWAKINLEKFHGNKEDTRRIGIESRKERGYSVPEDEFTPLEPIQIEKNEGAVNKGRDFAIGFFGWLIIWNSLGYLAYWYIGIAILLEFIGLILPFALGKKWIGFGAASYVITNAIVISVLSGEFALYGLIIPIGAMLFLQ